MPSRPRGRASRTRSSTRRSRRRSSQVFLDAVPKSKRLPTDARWTEAEDAADLALERYYYGDLSLDETIERIERETGPLLRGRMSASLALDGVAKAWDGERRARRPDARRRGRAS